MKLKNATPITLNEYYGTLEQEALDNIMKIVVISMREGNEVYEIAAKRESR